MAITIDENEDFAGNEFTPFYDGAARRIEQAKNVFANSSQGYDTTLIDKFRQGVSIRSSKDLYGSTQPKIWAGNLHHYIKVSTIGQARDSVEFGNSAIFEELPIFNPVWYVDSGSSYPFPIVFNNGPQQEEEASIEPFTIPFRKPNPYGNYFPRSPKASLEDGNNFDNLDGGTTRVEQFIEYNIPTSPRFFLDEGGEYYGPLENAIVIDGYAAFNQRDVVPFNDTRDEQIVEQINTTDVTFISELKKMKFGLDEDIRGTYDRKSATAGNIVYGNGAARYGTDSIAFAGMIKGS